MNTIPPFLQKGQKVALVSPAGCITTACLERGIRLIESWGLKYETGLHALKRYGTFAGTDEERAEDFQRALDNPEIKAIICTRGGYGSARIIDRLDFSRFCRNPKWIVGFSDIEPFCDVATWDVVYTAIISLIGILIGALVAVGIFLVVVLKS